MSLELAVELIKFGRPFNNGEVRLTWNTSHINKMSYQIFRSPNINETPELIDIVTGTQGITNYSYTDKIEGGIPNSQKVYYYQIKAYYLDGRHKEDSDLVGWDSDYRLFERHIMNMQDYLFTEQAGDPYYLYQRKLDGGQKCPKCWNVALNRPERSSEGCELCLGTGIVDPFYEAIVIFGANMRPQGLSQQVSDLGRIRDWGDETLYVNGIPIINVGDLLLDFKENNYYQVDDKQLIGRGHAPVLQILRIKKTPRQKDEYKFIEQDDRSVLAEQVREINKNRRW